MLHEDPPFDGDPTYKRKYLEKHRPPNWWSEWLKTTDTRKLVEETQKEQLQGGCRLRNFSGRYEDIIAEEVCLEICMYGSDISLFLDPFLLQRRR